MNLGDGVEDATFPLLLKGSWRKHFQVSAKMLLITVQTFKQVTRT